MLLLHFQILKNKVCKLEREYCGSSHTNWPRMRLEPLPFLLVSMQPLQQQQEKKDSILQTLERGSQMLEEPLCWEPITPSQNTPGLCSFPSNQLVLSFPWFSPPDIFPIFSSLISSSFIPLSLFPYLQVTKLIHFGFKMSLRVIPFFSIPINTMYFIIRKLKQCKPVSTNPDSWSPRHSAYHF